MTGTGITRNLHAALYHLRHPQKSRTIWIDALCINQYDVDERNHQISLMRSIYSNARRVISWLGEFDDESNIAMDYLSSNAWVGSNRLDAPANVINALASLFSRPYWTRVWIIQEVAVARHILIVCGDRTLLWEMLQQFVPLTRAISGVSGGVWSALARPRKLMRLTLRDEQDVIDILREGIDLKASVPADKVYGLLGLFPAGLKDRLTIDYRQPLCKVVEDVLKAYLDESQGSEVGADLSFMCVFPPLTGKGSDNGDNASWLPDIRNRVAGLAEWYDPSKGKVWSGRISLQYPALHVPAVPLGQIRATLGPFQTKRASLSNNFARTGRLFQASELRAVAMEGIRNRRPDETPTEHDVAFFHMVAGTRIFTQTRGRLALSHEELWSAVVESEASGVEPMQRVHDQFEIVFERLHDRKLLLLSDGSVGLGPSESCAGDFVFVLRTCSLPMVLRQTVSGEGEIATSTYSFVGPGYVDRAMRGEAMDSATEVQLRIR